MTEKILQHLKAKKSSPTVEYLQQLMTAYCSSVPWESVSKIVKKELAFKTSDCLRLEEEFWTSTFQLAFPQNLQCVPFKFANSKIFIPATIDVFLPRFFLSLCNNSIVVKNMVQQQFIKSEPFTNRSILLEEI